VSVAAASLLDSLECVRCHKRADEDEKATVCPSCGGPLYARYDLEEGKEFLRRETFSSRAPTMWRYAELLPVRDERYVTTLGEGSTPLLHLMHLGKDLGMRSLLLKDEGKNPTGTFKARGMSACVSRGRELGIMRFAVPTAGNAGGALAAYAAAGGCDAFVACPDDTPLANRVEVHVAGGTLRRVKGSIREAGQLVRDKVAKDGYFDVSTLREPYRLEGKKTMGIELAEALGWNVPDVVVYPTGGGTGLLGIWKAYEELEALDLIGSRRPRMVAVQSETCAPVVRAYAAGATECDLWTNPRTVASGLRVPKPFADREILHVIRASDGTAVSPTDDEILRAAWELASAEGVFACPEGAATVAALQQLRRDGWIDPKETVVLMNTGSGQKYYELFTKEPPHLHDEGYDPHDH
jgi:threonine synthase